MSEDKLSDVEKRLLEQLSKEKDPPIKLEQKVLSRLKEENLVERNTKKHFYIRWVASAAASILLFISGIYYERINTTNMVEIEPTKGYMLLLHEDEKFNPGDPMEMFEEYKHWMESTFERGVKITGQELRDEAVIVNQLGQKEKNDNEKRTTGYFLLEAESLEKAIRVAQENPHVKYGGSVEVKPYMVR